MKKKNDGIQWAIHNGNSAIGEGALVAIILMNACNDKWAAYRRSEDAVGLMAGQNSNYDPIKNVSVDGIKERYRKRGFTVKKTTKAVEDYGLLSEYLAREGYI